jgi:hypothetical protein
MIKSISGDVVAREALRCYLAKYPVKPRMTTRLMLLSNNKSDPCDKDFALLSIPEFVNKFIQPAVDNLSVWKEWGAAKMNLPEGLEVDFSIHMPPGMALSGSAEAPGVKVRVLRGFDIAVNRFVFRFDFLVWE